MSDTGAQLLQPQKTAGGGQISATSTLNAAFSSGFQLNAAPFVPGAPPGLGSGNANSGAEAARFAVANVNAPAFVPSNGAASGLPKSPTGASLRVASATFVPGKNTVLSFQTVL